MNGSYDIDFITSLGLLYRKKEPQGVYVPLKQI